MNTDILLPAVVLVIWSLIVLIWMAAVRFPAIAAANLSGNMKKPGGRGRDLNGVLPDKVNWKAHNYDHLMEQPTIFYPTVLILAAIGPAPLDIGLAWLYVALRILHSLWQALVNTIPVRLVLFTIASLVLLAMAIRALLALV